MLSDALMDYHFGWRWLLPHVPNQTVCLAGFAQAEISFCKNNVKVRDWIDLPQKADGCIINADNFLSLSTEKHTYINNESKWVAVVGTRVSVNKWRKCIDNRFSSIREYGLLPAENSRVVVPLTNANHAYSALTLHRPGRRIARYGVRLAGMLARLNVLFPLRRRVLLIAGRCDRWPMGAVHAGVSAQFFGKTVDYALYLGTPNDNRKTVVIPLGGQESNLLIKIGSSSKARKALHNEAFALRFLNDTSIKKRIPRLIEVVENEHCVALHQEYRPRGKASSKLFNQALIDFLAQLSLLGRRNRPLRLIIDEMFPNVVSYPKEEEDGPCSVVLRWLQRKAESGVEVWVCYGHGDLAPWNCMWTEKGLFVYDWEECTSEALAFTDAFYFVVAPVLHLSSEATTPEAVMTMALQFAGDVAKGGNLPPGDDIKIHFAIWLLLNQERHPFFSALTHVLSKFI